jgi:hypothetical protein
VADVFSASLPYAYSVSGNWADQGLDVLTAVKLKRGAGVAILYR